MKPPFGKRRREELAEEIEGHLQMSASDRIERGETAAQARAAAHREFGNASVVREVTRDQWGWRWLENLIQDLRFGFRMLHKSPGFTIVAVLTLALGIGANTAIFSVINSVMLTNLPVKDPQQLVLLTNPDEEGFETGFGEGSRDFLTYPEFQAMENGNQVFSGLFAASSFLFTLPVEVGRSQRTTDASHVLVKLVSGSYFSVLGVNPTLGRAFTTEVDRVRDANPVAVISYGFWQDHFAGSPDVLGGKIRIHSTSYQILGVTPPQFHGETVGADIAVWVPLTMESEIFPGRDYLSPETNPFHKTEWLQVMGRLRPGVALTQARASLNVEFQQIIQAQAAGISDRDKKQFLDQYLAVTDGSRGASTLRASFGKPLEILMTVVVLILLIACANVANILLARSAARQKEVAVRVALGAGAPRLFRQVLTESSLLAVIGGVFGLLLANWADALLLRMVSGGTSQVPLNLQPNATILLFTLGVSLLTGILFGLAPAFRATRVDLNNILKGTSHSLTAGPAHSGSMPIGKTLVVAQVALSLLLLVVAGLFVRSFRNLSGAQYGYDRNHLLEFAITPLSDGYKQPEVPALCKDILERIAAIPGVRGVSISDNGLLGGTDSQDPITIEGQKPKAGENHDARWDIVGPNFFATAGIPILAGREITAQDSGNGQRVGVINQTLAQRFFPNSNPIGQRIQVHESNGQFNFVIVGVAADSKHSSVRERPWPRFYVPFFNPVGDEWANHPYVIVRTAETPSALTSTIRGAVKQSAGNLPPVQIQTVNQRIAASLTTDRMITQLSGAFGILAILLVCIGLYGIMAYAVSRRTNEIGIRIALGAQRANVLWLILRDSLLLVLIGVAIGVPVVFAAGKWISSLLFGVEPADPLTLALGTGLMFVVGILACYIPARRAMRVDPMVALRYE